MKRVLVLLISLLTTAPTWSQSNPVDALFEKYSAIDGFTSVFISGKMLSMFAGDREKAENDLIFRIKSIMILSENDSLSKGGVNFYNELSKKLDFSRYEELMVVRDKQEVTKFLVKQTGSIINELLMISGGAGGNTLISIRGEIKLNDLSEISKTVGVEELKPLDTIDKSKNQ